MLKWLKSLFGAKQGEQTANTENTAAEMPAPEANEAPAEEESEDLTPGLSSDDTVSEEESGEALISEDEKEEENEQ